MNRKAEAALYARRRVWFWEMKTGSCADCGVEYPPYVMQFDHVRGRKLFFINLQNISRSMASLICEIAKCDLVCVNCHAERTQRRLC